MTKQEKSLLTESETSSLADFFKLFGDSSRLKLLCLLSADAEKGVCEIAEEMGVTQPAISYQLKLLHRAHLVKKRRKGKGVLYSLNNDKAEAIIRMARAHLTEK